MRKLMNKKGFSLVELMIVVVIMGILIAVAIPLYGAIQRNANEKTCGNNIKTIKSNCATYMTSYNKTISTKAELQAMFDDNAMPECPLSDDGTDNDYVVVVDNTKGSAKVACKNFVTGDHAPNGAEAANNITATATETALA